MPGPTPQIDPRISLAAVHEMNQLARRLRHRLREVAVEVWRKDPKSDPIGPETILQAVPHVCREILSNPGARFGDERGSDGKAQEAA